MNLLILCFIGIIICLSVIYIILYLYNFIREIIRDIFKETNNSKKIDQGYNNNDTKRKGK